MEELVKTFHIETNLLVAQVINFSIVLLVLYKFAYGPILKTLNARTKKIEKGLKDSEMAQKKLEDIAKKEKEILSVAKKESQNIIQKGEESALKNAQEIVVKAKEEADKILRNSKIEIENEKRKILTEIKSEVADLVVSATEKIIEEKIDKEKDKKLIEKVLNS